MSQVLQITNVQSVLDNLNTNSCNDLLESLISIPIDEYICNLSEDDGKLLVNKLENYLTSRMLPGRYLSRLFDDIEKIEKYFSKLRINIEEKQFVIEELLLDEVLDEYEATGLINDFGESGGEVHKLFQSIFCKLLLSEKKFYTIVVEKLNTELEILFMSLINKDNCLSSGSSACIVRDECNKLKQKCIDVLNTLNK